jgi:hypothetical protein
VFRHDIHWCSFLLGTESVHRMDCYHDNNMIETVVFSNFWIYLARFRFVINAKTYSVPFFVHKHPAPMNRLVWRTGNLELMESTKSLILPLTKEYGGNYKQIAKGIPVGSLEKAPVILEILLTYITCLIHSPIS